MNSFVHIVHIGISSWSAQQMAGFYFEKNHLTHNQGALIARNQTCYPCVGLSFEEICGVDVCVMVLFDTSCWEFARMVKLQMSVFCILWHSCQFFPCCHFVDQFSSSSLYHPLSLSPKPFSFPKMPPVLFSQTLLQQWFLLTNKLVWGECVLWAKKS